MEEDKAREEVKTQQKEVKIAKELPLTQLLKQYKWMPSKQTFGTIKIFTDFTDYHKLDISSCKKVRPLFVENY